MDAFKYRNGELWCDELLAAEAAERFSTPLYVYAWQTFQDHYENLRDAFAAVDPLICYSIKSCSNVHILRRLHELGSGFDVVSGGELHRALHVGADPAKVVFAGVGKSEREVVEALDAGIGVFNIESESELQQLSALAEQRGQTVHAALRVNPDVDPQTHKYTATGIKESKFGVNIDLAADVFRRAAPHPVLRLSGIHLHIGSPVYETSHYIHSIERALGLMRQLRADGLVLDTLDIGGGFGANYRGDESPTAAQYAAAIVPLVRDQGLRIILEPGRTISGNAGILLTRVLHTKQTGERRIVIVDASMNELIRPALYGAYHFIWPVAAGERMPHRRGAEQPFADLVHTDVVGPICESGDFLAQDRRLPPVQQGDLLAVFTAGAYGMSMASQYNSRPRAAEVLVDGYQPQLIRRRETYVDLLAPELDIE